MNAFSKEDRELLDSVKKNHDFWRAAYKAMGREELFFLKFWDGYDNFDDYVMYGDAFPRIDFTAEKKEADEIQKEVDKYRRKMKEAIKSGRPL